MTWNPETYVKSSTYELELINGILIRDNPLVQSTVITGSYKFGKTRCQFWGGRKPECPKKTLEVRLRSTETQSTYNIVCGLNSSRGGRRDWCPLRQPDFPRSTAQDILSRGHLSRHQPRPTGLNFSEQTGTGVSLWWYTKLNFYLTRHDTFILQIKCASHLKRDPGVLFFNQGFFLLQFI